VKIKEIYIAKLIGAVFVDPLASMVTEDDWGHLCEKVRPSVREALADVGIHGKLDIQIAGNGFQFEYEVEDIKRTVSVSKDQLSFDFGRFLVSQGLPGDIGKVVSRALPMIGRDDWIGVGAKVSVALPMSNAEKSSIGADAIQRNLLISASKVAHAIFDTGTLEIVDLRFKGKVGSARVDWNIYNTKEQHLVLTQDIQRDRHEMEDDNIDTFLSNVYDAFLQKCGPLVQVLLDDSNLAEYLDIDYLRTGRRG